MAKAGKNTVAETHMRISVITPSLNSGGYIKRSIESVRMQHYADVEHIVIDGGSTDATLDILKSYPHLQWISEPDRNQVHAMCKGFMRSTGDIIVYLNADEYFLEGAFDNALKAFDEDTDMVVGNVHVAQENRDGGITRWINRPRVDCISNMRHWEADAFCIRPVGYFYRRQVQEICPYLEEDGTQHALSFLVRASSRFAVKKLDMILGEFDYRQGSRTAEAMSLPSYWSEANFQCITDMAEKYLDLDALRQFQLDRQRGYQQLRHQILRELMQSGLKQSLFTNREVVALPENGLEGAIQQNHFCDARHLATRGDWVFLVASSGKVASTAITSFLTNADAFSGISKTYHIHYLAHEKIEAAMRSQNFMQHNVVEKAVNAFLKKHRDDVTLKIISGVRCPVSSAISAYYENNMYPVDGRFYGFRGTLKWITGWFDTHLKTALGIDVYEHEFDKDAGYAIIKQGNIEVLLYTFEKMPHNITSALKDFIGINDARLPELNKSSDKSYRKEYQNTLATMRFEADILDLAYASKYARHFYTDDFIEAAYSRWSQ